jgi:hypothetical protein
MIWKKKGKGTRKKMEGEREDVKKKHDIIPEGPQ